MGILKACPAISWEFYLFFMLFSGLTAYSNRNLLYSMIRLLIFISVISGIPFLFSCGNKNENKPVDTPTTGTISIGVDETLAPIIRAEIDVFQSIYFTAKINDIRCSEIDAFNLLMKDSVRMIIASRTLNTEEKDFFSSKKIFPIEVKIAVDAIALIVHKNNSDTLLSVNTVKDILTGKIKSWDEINTGSKLGPIKTVFDNPKSSTAEFAVKTICNNQPLSSDLSALNNNKEVIDFVAVTPNSLGIIGVNWISNQKDTTCIGFLDKIKVIAISKENIPTEDNSFQPYQAYMATRQYPYSRDIYAVLADPRIGLTSGFTSFITSDRGQRIILKSGILPVTQPVRIIQVKDEL